MPSLLCNNTISQVCCACLLLRVLLQVHLLEPEKPGQPRRLQTEGINFPGVWQQQSLLDVNAIACNDVHAMLTTYGVEAARATILREVQVCDKDAGCGVVLVDQLFPGGPAAWPASQAYASSRQPLHHYASSRCSIAWHDLPASSSACNF
jgi:hypothetical protein